MNLRVTLFSLIILLSVFCFTPAAAQQADLLTIEPGWRVGPVVMSMTRRDVEKIYGEAEIYVIPDTDRNIELTMMQYKNLGLNIIFNGGNIEEMEVNYPNYKLKNQIRVGSSAQVVETAMGSAFIREDYQHAEEVTLPDYKMIYAGIIFYIKKDRVVKITVKRRY